MDKMLFRKPREFSWSYFAEGHRNMINNGKHSEEFEKFDKAMDKIMSVSKKELDRRLAEASGRVNH